VPTEELDEINLAGVFSFARGLFRRGPISPAQTTYRSFNRLVADDIVISTPKAWEGAIARVSPEFEGWFLSPVFPTFRCDCSRLLPAFLEWYCRQEPVWRELQAKSRGIGARRESVHPDQFLSLEIPLPPLSEQRRIVARIEELAAQISEARKLRQEGAMESGAMFPTHRAALFAELANTAATRPLGEMISMSSGEGLTSSQMDDSAPYPVYGGGGLNGRFSRYLFEDPKIAIGRVGARCGCVFMTAPKSWITDNALYLDKVSPELDPSYLVHALSALDLRQQANQAAQPVVSQKKINPLKIAVPGLPNQCRIVAELDALQAQVDALKRLQAETADELDALLPAVLDRAFKGKL
jgi:type I restriction enzyme S subunit